MCLKSLNQVLDDLFKSFLRVILVRIHNSEKFLINLSQISLDQLIVFVKLAYHTLTIQFSLLRFLSSSFHLVHLELYFFQLQSQFSFFFRWTSNKYTDRIAQVTKLQIFVSHSLQLLLDHNFYSVVLASYLVVFRRWLLHQVTHLTHYVLLKLVQLLFSVNDVLLYLLSLSVCHLIACSSNRGLNVSVLTFFLDQL